MRVLFVSFSVLLLVMVYFLPAGQVASSPAAILEASASSDAVALTAGPEVRRQPIASLTKLMTALVVLENYDLNKKIVITDAAMEQVGQQGELQAGQVLSVSDLLHITLIESSNRAAYALTEAIGSQTFVATMNEKAAQLGMADTHFEDSTGLSSKSVSTVENVKLLSEYLFDHYPLFREIVGLKEYSLYINGVLHHTLVNTNKMLGVLGIIGGKTGWTSEAKGCFMAAQYDSQTGKYHIHVVLGAEDRFLEMQKLINSEK